MENKEKESCGAQMISAGASSGEGGDSAKALPPMRLEVTVCVMIKEKQCATKTTNDRGTTHGMMVG